MNRGKSSKNTFFLENNEAKRKLRQEKFKYTLIKNMLKAWKTPKKTILRDYVREAQESLIEFENIVGK